MWNSSQKPSMRFSNSGSSASGVTSRPVKPVPPVVMTTSTSGSAIQRRTWRRIASRRRRDDGAGGEEVAGRRDPLGQRVAGLVVGQRAGVGDGQHRDVERNELFCFIDGRHAKLSS